MATNNTAGNPVFVFMALTVTKKGVGNGKQMLQFTFT